MPAQGHSDACASDFTKHAVRTTIQRRERIGWGALKSCHACMHVPCAYTREHSKAAMRTVAVALKLVSTKPLPHLEGALNDVVRLRQRALRVAAQDLGSVAAHRQRAKADMHQK
eukprot:1147322-Pelagomonas_calceolata.AAC.8